MEIANNPTADAAVRAARRQDLETLHALLREQFYTHTHVDWHQLEDWLDEPGFLLLANQTIHAFLTTTAAPPPAAWVRAVSLRYGTNALQQLTTLLEAAIDQLRPQGITSIGWMSNKRWADRLLPELGFEIEHYLESYWKDDLEIPSFKAPTDLHIRSVLPEEMRTLAHLEALAFDPLWRHDQRGLQLAWRQSLSLDVALLSGQIVGFQHTVPGENQSVHLARMTIHPHFHGRGIGSALLAHAIGGYKRRGYRSVSLNTVDNNTAAQHLYTKFGFHPIEHRLPVWVRHI